MKKSFFLPGLMSMILFLCTSCACHTYHFGVQNRAAMVPDDFGETEAAIAHAEQSEGAKYCPDKLARAKQLAHDGAEVYWACRNTESSRLLAEARRLAKEAEGCGPQAAAPAPPAPAPVPEKQPVKVCIPLNIEFQIDSAEILPEYDRDIERVSEFMKKNPGSTAVIEGHTDNVGTAEYNLKLSQRRAESVVTRLVDKFGIDKSRLEAKGYGLTQPIADNKTQEGKQKNRRIEAVITCSLEKDFVPPPSKVCIQLMIDFATDSAEIDPKYDSQVAQAADFMKVYPETTAIVEGHTDDVGDADYNMKLSQKRAESVMNLLVDKYGIDKSRLSAKGYGDTRRLVYNTTAEARQKNRRVEVWVDCVLIYK
ncbi:MAG TPA: OmpA family protein [Geobacteraceae bacterium]|nr:OmpA family protein [Geobacteraceae bacterium]